MTSGFPYKKVLVVGATSGIGEALAERMIDNGISVIAVGRRQERIDAFVEKYGKEKASGISFDLTARDKIPDFVTTYATPKPPSTFVLELTPTVSSSETPTLTAYFSTLASSVESISPSQKASTWT